MISVPLIFYLGNLRLCSMSDQGIVNVNSVETNFSNNVIHRGAPGDPRVATNANDNTNSNNADTNEGSSNHGHRLGESNRNEQQPIFNLDIRRMSYLLMLIGFLLVMIAYTITMKVDDTPSIPINLLKAFYITSKVLLLWGMFLLLFALCGTYEVSVNYALTQRTFLWATVPLVVVVFGLKVSIFIISLIHND